MGGVRRHNDFEPASPSGSLRLPFRINPSILERTAIEWIGADSTHVRFLQLVNLVRCATRPTKLSIRFITSGSFGRGLLPASSSYRSRCI